MVRISVYYDSVAAPIPVGDITQIEGRDAPVPVVKPEPAGATASQVPYVGRTESARKVAVLKGMVQVELRSVTTLVMTYPLTICMDVGCFGVTRLIAKTLGVLRCGVFGRGRMLLLARGGRFGRGLGSARWSVPAANVFLAAGGMFALMLSERAR